MRASAWLGPRAALPCLPVGALGIARAAPLNYAVGHVGIFRRPGSVRPIHPPEAPMLTEPTQGTA